MYPQIQKEKESKRSLSILSIYKYYKGSSLGKARSEYAKSGAVGDTTRAVFIYLQLKLEQMKQDRPVYK